MNVWKEGGLNRRHASGNYNVTANPPNSAAPARTTHETMEEGDTDAPAPLLLFVEVGEGPELLPVAPE